MQKSFKILSVKQGIPGNDGLSIEFYKTFWDLIGDPLVASFNESFAKGTMSPSQSRQADEIHRGLKSQTPADVRLMNR